MITIRFTPITVVYFLNADDVETLQFQIYSLVFVFRETQDPSLLATADKTVRQFFPRERFTALSLFIVTWVDVGYYKLQYDRVRHNLVD